MVLFTILGLLFSFPLFIALPPLLFLLSLWHALNKAALPVVYFDQLVGVCSTQKLVEIHNNCPPILLHIMAYFNVFTRD